MSENHSAYVGGCPPWCRTVGGADDGGPHAHVSADLVVGGTVEGTAARMIQLTGSDQVRVVVGESVVGLEEAEAFAHALLRLTADARLAQPGLGFVEQLLQQRGMSTGELALAAGLDVERVRAQRSGAAVLTVREFDRVALAAAQLHCLVDGDRPAVPEEPGEEPVVALVEEPAEARVGEPAEARVEQPAEEPVAQAVLGPVVPAEVKDVFDGATWADLMELMALAGGSMLHEDDEPTDDLTDEPVDEEPAETTVDDTVDDTADDTAAVRAEDTDEPAGEHEVDDEDAPVDEDEPVRPALELVSEHVAEPRRVEVEEDWAFAQVELVELIRLGGGPQQPAV